MIVATLGQDIKYLRVFPSLLRLIFTCTSIHAVSSFRVLTDGRLTAACPRNGEIPPREVQATQFEELLTYKEQSTKQDQTGFVVS